MIDPLKIDPLKLIANRQADNRQAFAERVLAQKETELTQQQFMGTYLGNDADQGVAFVEIKGEQIPCESITSGLLTAGQNVIVTIPSGAKLGIIDGIGR